MVGRLSLALASPLPFSFWVWLSLHSSCMPWEPFILLTWLMALLTHMLRDYNSIWHVWLRSWF